jgi:3-oxoadipate enol-lactonase
VTYATALLPGLEARFVERRGVRIRVWEGGAGRPLLLVHGLGGAAWNFCELVPRLPGRRLIVPDLPGHGASTPLPGSSGLAGYADALAACLDGPADVLGHSLGGAVALRLAERHPSLVRGLVLAAAAGITSSTRLAQAVIALATTIQPGRRLGRYADAIARSRALRRLVFGAFTDPALLSDLAIHGLLRGPTMHTDTLGAGLALAADDPRLDLERVRCPVLVLWGASDLQVPLEDGFEYARRLRAEIRVIADCGHLLVVERPDVCARAAQEFLR